MPLTSSVAPRFRQGRLVMFLGSRKLALAIGLLTGGLLANALSAQELAADPYAAARQQLVETRIQPAGVKNPEVLRVMRETPRHEFVPEAMRPRAYYDMSLPIGDAQTISSPFIVAWMTETIDPQPTDRVLEIGTGSGYQAAVLSPLVQEVYTIEIVPTLGERAKRTLERLNYQNVQVRVGDGFLGWPEAAPFDKIIVTCSPENIPQPLVDQLREGGKILIPVGERFQQSLYLKTKVDGKLVGGPLQPTLFVPMTGRAEASRQRQPDPANPFVVNGDFEAAFPRDGSVPTGAIPGWYYERQATLIRGEAFEGEQFIRFRNETPELAANLMQGLPLDGRVITSIRLSGTMRTEGVKPGGFSDSLPAIILSLFDDQRRQIEMVVLGPFQGTRPWRTSSRLIRVPPQSREAVVRIGLFGATGTADFDQIRIETVQ